MTEPFAASNGIQITMDTDRDGKVYLVGHRARGDEGQYLDTHATGGPEGIVALREFFQHERDEELGLWRSPTDPTWTAVRRNTAIYFQNEDHERSFHFVPKLEGSIRAWSADLQALAYEYIEAHPERKPLPEIDGIYAVSPNVHPYERLIQRRNGEWIHLRRSASEFETDNISAQSIAQSAVDEGRLTRLVAEHAS